MSHRVSDPAFDIGQRPISRPGRPALVPAFEAELYTFVRSDAYPMKAIHFCILASAFCLTVSCAEQEAKETTEVTTPATTLWPGIYTGITPCADCAGIETILTLNQNRTYLLRTKYLGKGDAVFEKRGALTFNSEGNKITLTGIDDGPAQYLLGDHMLTQLDLSGALISGRLADQYILRRSATSELVGIRWNLDNLMGKQLRLNPAYVMFDVQRGRIGGYGWCNAYNGELRTGDQNNITISNVTAGANICADTMLEAQFLNMFAAVNQFSIQGDQLSLYRVESTPLAVFRKADIRLPPGQGLQ